MTNDESIQLWVNELLHIDDETVSEIRSGDVEENGSHPILQNDDEHVVEDQPVVNDPPVARSRCARRLVPTPHLEIIHEPVRRPSRPPRPQALQGGICVRMAKVRRKGVHQTSAIGQQSFAEDCPVCLVKKATMRTQCGHVFCSGCIWKVCFTKPVCPYCRGPIHALEVVDRALYEAWKEMAPALNPGILRIV